MTVTTGYRGDESLRRPPSESFLCGETIIDDDEDETGCVVNFHCTVPNDGAQLEFCCREPSCGVLINDEKKAEKKEDGAMDPNFFDEGYTLAGKTGWQVWPGSRLLVESLTFPQASFDGEKLKTMQTFLASGARVLELGAGVGMVGSSLANSGAQVLLTDLPALVENSLVPNLDRNEGANVVKNEDLDDGKNDCPVWLRDCDAVQIGKGWAGAASVDWIRPLNEQLSEVQRNVDIVVASDCVWLISMLNGLLGTVEAIFQSSKERSPKLLMSFQRRDPKDGESSNMFTTVDRVLAEIRERNWSIECLSWFPVSYKGEEDKEVFVFEISPNS
jgi:hypothetical protein